MNLRFAGISLLALLGLVACGGSKTTDSPAAASSTSLVGTWGNATETDTFNANGTFAISKANCTYTGGTYSVAGNKLTVTAVPTTAVASGTVAPATACTTATTSTLNGYSFTYTISGNSLTYVDATGTYTVHQLLGKWTAPITGGTEVYTFNAGGTYVYDLTATGLGTCTFTGGTYTVSGETLTFTTAPTAGSGAGVTCTPSALAALAGLVNTITMTSATTLTATSKGVVPVVTNYTRI